MQHQVQVVQVFGLYHLKRQCRAAHGQADQAFQCGAGVVGVQGGADTAMARVQGLEEHLGGIRFPDLADDDPVRPLAQGRRQQSGQGQGRGVFGVVLLRLHLDNVGGVELDLAYILAHHDAIARGDGKGQGIEQGGLAAVGGAGNQYVIASRHCVQQGLLHGGADGMRFHQPLQVQVAAPVQADRQAATRRRGRRQGRAHPAAVRQAGIDDRRFYRVEILRQGVGDLLDQGGDLGVIAKSQRGLVHPARGVVRPHVIVAVDHDVGHPVVIEQGLYG